MKCLLLLLTFVYSMSSAGSQLDLRKFQYPVEDAKRNAKMMTPKFCTYYLKGGAKPRMPAVNSDQGRVIRNKYRIQVMNEYRLYTEGDIDNQEKVLLERYCTRYNRTLLRELGL